MNADRLFALCDRVAEAPDAVGRMRRFVLDLAVRGKLVEQDPADEPASELLTRIAAEKARLASAGRIKRKKVLPALEEPPFSVPDNWRWARIREITSDRGQKVPKEAFTYIDVTAIDKENGLVVGPRVLEPSEAPSRARKVAQLGDVVYSCVRPYLLNVAVILDDFDPPPIASTAFAILNGHGFVLPRYIWIVLRSPFMVASVEKSQRGQAYPAINNADFAVLPFPLPPLAEQHRIVAKVDELMALCDQLEEAHTVREDTRDRLTKASLTRLIAHDIDAPTFRSHARFAVGALPALTARADQVKHLRQTILGLAVRGKLVEQDPADGPLPSIDGAIPHDLEPPFRVPAHWRWSRIRALGTLKGGGTPSKARGDFWNGSIPWVSPKEMKLDYIANAKMRITEAAIAASAVNVIEPESILFVVRGMILAHSFPVAISRVPLTINQDMKAVILKKPEMAEYLLRALKALKPEMLARVQRSSHGTCRIVGTDYGDFMIPIPPFAEQHRIVAKVDELMALCDRMATGLAAADGTRIRLLDSLLHDALASAAYEAATTTRPGARNTWTERARSGGVPSRS